MKDTVTYRGYEIEILTDRDPSNPRTEFDNLGTMVCWHSRYNLGDVEKGKPLSRNYYSMEYFIAEIAGLEYDKIPDTKGMNWLLEKANEKNIILPLYLYDHSGITIKTSPFTCRWDSGQVGWIYVPVEAVKKEWKWEKLTASRREKIEKILKSEVKIYDDFLTGEVYGYNVEETGDSCWGYYGDDHKLSGLLEAAESSIDYHIKKKIKDHLKQLKEWIKNKVPLIYRQPYQPSL